MVVSRRQKRTLLSILLSAALFTVALFLQEGSLRMVLLLAAYALSGWEVLLEAGRNILRGEVFDENFLMAIATVGAIVTHGRFQGGCGDLRSFPHIRGCSSAQPPRRSRAGVAGIRQR